MMKKNLPKIPRIKKKEAPAGRITSDTIAEHRQHVLAEGRRFKYPVQYVKYRLVINTVIIALVSILVVGLVFWWQLYRVQNSGDLFYRVSAAFSLPVAKVDGEPVKFSDYLMRYRSSVQYLSERDQIDLGSADGKTQANAIKRRELDGVIADTYAAKLAKENNISISEEELEEFIIQERKSVGGGVSEATYDSAIATYYGWSPSEYRQIMRSKLLLRKVSYEVDTSAQEVSKEVEGLVKEGKDLESIANSIELKKKGSVVYSIPMWVPKDNYDGGLSEAASKMKKGETSGPIKSTRSTGYYFIKLIDSNETQVQYEVLQVVLGEFDKMLEEVKAQEGGVKEYIHIEAIDGEGDV